MSELEGGGVHIRNYVRQVVILILAGLSVDRS
jgi:hypothetical protein